MTDAAEIKVIASGGLKAAALELIPGFEQASGHRVITAWAGSVDIRRRMEAGETFDLVIMPGTFIDELIKLGKVVAGSRADLAQLPNLQSDFTSELAFVAAQVFDFARADKVESSAPCR